MRAALVAALVFTPLAASAQMPVDGPIRRVLTPVLPDTVTTDALDEDNGRATLRATGAPYTGVVRDLWPDGRFKLLRSVEDGRAAGLWTEWYPTGIIRYLAEWHPEGPGEGVWFYFHESGLVRDRTIYRRDRAWGPSEGWHANGRKAFEGQYRDNVRVGRWRWWNADGGIDSTRTFPTDTTEINRWRTPVPDPELVPPLADPGAFRPGGGGGERDGGLTQGRLTLGRMGASKPQFRAASCTHGAPCQASEC